MKSANLILVSGGCLGFLAIGFGAYADHGLKSTISAQDFESVSTALRFQLSHALLLVSLGLSLLLLTPSKIKSLLFVAAILCLLGTLCFCGGIYMAVVGGLREAIHLTPFGGILLMIAWLFVAAAGLVKLK